VPAQVAPATALVAVSRALGGGWPQGQPAIARTDAFAAGRTAR
jgi:hypothetical protein